jgi:hypothetical protein
MGHSWVTRGRLASWPRVHAMRPEPFCRRPLSSRNSVSAAASLLAQYLSFNVAPGGLGEPGPLQYLLSTHTLEHLNTARRPACPVEALTGLGDQAHRTPAPHRRRAGWSHAYPVLAEAMACTPRRQHGTARRETTGSLY